jgi:hypothetical protein
LSHPFAIIAQGKLYRKGFKSFPDLLLSELEDEAQAIEYFEKAFQNLLEKVNKLEEQIDASQNKGSFLAKLKHIKDTLDQHKGLGDYVALYDRLAVREVELEGQIAINRQKNLEIKQALLLEALDMKDSVDWRNTAERMKVLRQNWIKTGSVPDEFTAELEAGFKASLDYFFERRNQFLDEKNAMIRQAEEKYQALIHEASSLKNLSLSEAKQKVRELMIAWKDLPKIPGGNLKRLWSDFSRYIAPYKKKTTPTAGVSRFRPTRSGSPRFGRPSDSPQSILEREKLFAKLKGLFDQMPQDAEQQLADLSNVHKELGRALGEKGRMLQNSFNQLAAMTREKLYLLRLVNSKFEGFEALSPDQQKRHMINILSELILRDEREYDVFNENLQNVSRLTEEAEKMMKRKQQSYVNRIAAKKALLKQLGG